jgi:hypothetical protein
LYACKISVKHNGIIKNPETLFIRSLRIMRTSWNSHRVKATFFIHQKGKWWARTLRAFFLRHYNYECFFEVIWIARISITSATFFLFPSLHTSHKWVHIYGCAGCKKKRGERHLITLFSVFYVIQINRKEQMEFEMLIETLTECDIRSISLR